MPHSINRPEKKARISKTKDEGFTSKFLASFREYDTNSNGVPIIPELDPNEIERLKHCSSTDGTAPYKPEREDLIVFSKLLNENKTDSLKEIIQSKSFNMETTDKYGNTAIHYATNFKNLEAIEALIDKGANINAQNAKGNTPLHVSVQLGDALAARILLKAGADKNIKNNHNKRPVELANMQFKLSCQEFVQNLQNKKSGRSL